MGSFVSDSLFVPAVALALLAFGVPRLMSKLLPEGVKPLLLNAFVSTVLLFVNSATFFAVLYIWQGVPLAEMMVPGWAANIAFFGRLGLISAIVWAPIMLLSVAGLPKKWVNETW